MKLLAIISGAALLIILVFSCSDNHHPLISRIEKVFTENDETLKISEITEFSWDNFCIYGGYASSSKYNIENSEGDWTIIFFRGTEISQRVQGTSRRFLIYTSSPPGQFPCFDQQAIARIQRFDYTGNRVRIIHFTGINTVPEPK